MPHLALALPLASNQSTPRARRRLAVVSDIPSDAATDLIGTRSAWTSSRTVPASETRPPTDLMPAKTALASATSALEDDSSSARPASRSTRASTPAITSTLGECATTVPDGAAWPVRTAWRRALRSDSTDLTWQAAAVTPESHSSASKDGTRTPKTERTYATHAILPPGGEGKWACYQGLDGLTTTLTTIPPSAGFHLSTVLVLSSPAAHQTTF